MHKSLQVQCIDAIAAIQVNALALVVLGCIIAWVSTCSCDEWYLLRSLLPSLVIERLLVKC